MKRVQIITVMVLFIVVTSVSGCRRKSYRFIHTKPDEAEIVGRYVLIDQTVIKGGLSALQGRECQLELHPDGSFRMTNYPYTAGARSASLRYFKKFTSTTGSWELATVGTTYDATQTPKRCWGIYFYGTDENIHSTAFTGQAPPYELVTILGDPDSHNTLRFKKVTAASFKKETAIQNTNTPSVPETSEDAFQGKMNSDLFHIVALTDEIEEACQRALTTMRLVYKGETQTPVHSMEDARALIFSGVISFSMANSPHACIEYDGWFFISKFGAKEVDDGSFQSGIAVKKGTADIYRWEMANE